jgi:signal transduction histidine kinase
VNFRDVTARVRAEAEVRSLNTQLERRVVERTAQLEMANKDLEAFSYSVSHDLRGPLRAIDGFSKILLDEYGGALDERGREYLDHVRTSAGRMNQLIEDLLSLARVTEGAMEVRRVDVSALARGIAHRLQDTQPERRVQFVIADGLVADGDARLLHVALENLLGNAWKYTGRHPSARIEVGRLLATSDPGGDAADLTGRSAFFVRDDGAGFPPEDAGKIFRAFQRSHDASEFEGTGIGLATTQRIIHRHRGRIWAEGAVEQGATFFFTLGT